MATITSGSYNTGYFESTLTQQTSHDLAITRDFERAFLGDLADVREEENIFFYFNVDQKTTNTSLLENSPPLNPPNESVSSVQKTPTFSQPKPQETKRMLRLSWKLLRIIAHQEHGAYQKIRPPLTKGTALTRTRLAFLSERFEITPQALINAENDIQQRRDQGPRFHVQEYFQQHPEHNHAFYFIDLLRRYKQKDWKQLWDFILNRDPK